jgi:hypothetical protein
LASSSKALKVRIKRKKDELADPAVSGELSRPCPLNAMPSIRRTKLPSFIDAREEEKLNAERLTKEKTDTSGGGAET